MPVLALSIGSNQDAAAHIRRAVTALRQHFVSLRCSTVYESEAVGFDGDNFLNLVALTSTDDDLGEIAAYLKHLEDELGRDRSLPKFAARRIDIDILCYGEEDGQQHGLRLPRAEVTENAFVLRPLAEVMPGAVHAPTGKSYAQLWAEYDHTRQALWPVEFYWQAD